MKIWNKSGGEQSPSQEGRLFVQMSDTSICVAPMPPRRLMLPQFAISSSHLWIVMPTIAHILSCEILCPVFQVSMLQRMKPHCKIMTVREGCQGANNMTTSTPRRPSHILFMVEMLSLCYNKFFLKNKAKSGSLSSSNDLKLGRLQEACELFTLDLLGQISSLSLFQFLMPCNWVFWAKGKRIRIWKQGVLWGEV